MKTISAKSMTIFILTFSLVVCTLYVGDEDLYANSNKPQKPGVVRVKKHNETSLKLTWKKVKNVDGYDVLKYHKKKKKYIVIKSTKKTELIDKVGKNKSGKYRVRSYKMDNGKKIISKSRYYVKAKTYDDSSNFVNASRKIKVSKKKVKLAAGYSKKIKASIKSSVPGKKVYSKKIRWKSNNKKVAVVSKNGRIKGKGDGACYVYARTHNGYCKRIKIIVKDYARPQNFNCKEIGGVPETVSTLKDNLKDVGDIASYFRDNEVKKVTLISYNEIDDCLSLNPKIKIKKSVESKILKLLKKDPDMFIEIDDNYISFVRLSGSDSYNEVIHVFGESLQEDYYTFRIAPRWYFMITDNV